MDSPKVTKGQWIRIGKGGGIFNSIDGYVINIYPDGTLGVGYYQDKLKAVKEDVVWDGESWSFKYPGPNASYLRGSEEAIVKRGPQY